MQLLRHSFNNPVPINRSKNVGYSLWKEDTECLQWLDTKPPNSVLYVYFGSIAVIIPQKLVELGMVLAQSKQAFLWVIRPHLAVVEPTILPPKFAAEIRERSLVTSWCPQEQILNRPSVCDFLTHSGWNSTIESIFAGVPMLCWPFFADQQTNSRFMCNEWGIGIKIHSDVKRDIVEKLVREFVEGEKGKEMRTKAMDWKRLAKEATAPHGSSSVNLDRLVNKVILKKQK